jgi:orotidine-5'-phosphate decarboxylase
LQISVRKTRANARTVETITLSTGNTVSLQYSSGVHKIASWAHITNAHTVPGPSIVSGLASVGMPLGRGLLLLAEMSTVGNLAVGQYTRASVRIAMDHRDFVIGFIAQRRMDELAAQDSGTEIPDFLILTPGVGLGSREDGKGQQYRTPEEVITESACDLIIVGRGIYGQGDQIDIRAVESNAKRYQKEGWEAYLKRIS